MMSRHTAPSHEDTTPWSALKSAFLAFFGKKQHAGQNQTVRVENHVRIDDPLGGNIEGGYSITASNVTQPHSGHHH